MSEQNYQKRPQESQKVYEAALIYFEMRDDRSPAAAAKELSKLLR